MRASVARATRPEVLGGFGGFAGLFDASALRAYRRPVLATSTDGVGTKVDLARQLQRYDTIGYDLVGMLVDDLVVCGAEPLFVTDYLACGRVAPERVAAIVGGVAQACQLAGAALLGGETAEHPGLLGADEFDLAGATTGVVEADAILGVHRVRVGDVVLALASSGVHANGYSLVRHVLREAGWSLDREVPELGGAVGAVLLEPTRIYARDCLALAAALGDDLHAMAHVTGGGIAANLARVLPDDAGAVVDRGTWQPAPVFDVLAQLGGVAQDEAERTWNQGIGMLAVVAADAADQALGVLAGVGYRAWVCGEVGPRAGDDTDAAVPAVELVGRHR